MIEEVVADRGSYLLILHLKQDRTMEIGKLGEISFRKGFYIYVGSAMTNLFKRMERHRHLRKRHHWHIDDLRDAADFHSCLAIRSSIRLECQIAQAMAPIAGWRIARFGSSDCHCETHLFGMTGDPLYSRAFQNILQYFRMDRYSV